LEQLNLKRYEAKIADAVDDEEGINALEELLSTDPSLADLFGSVVSGKVAAKTATNANGGKVNGTPEPFQGLDFPTFFARKDGTTSVETDFPRGDATRISFQTDVKNNYFSRKKHRGKCEFKDGFQPTFHLFNGRLTFTFHVDKNVAEGTKLQADATITDNTGTGPFTLTLIGNVVTPKEKPVPDDDTPPKPDPKVQASTSRPDVIEVENGPDDPPITIEKAPNTDRLKLVVNKGSRLLLEAKSRWPPEEEAAVEFVFKYGLALTAMGLLDSVRKTTEWTEDEAGSRSNIEKSAAGVARVIVPLCLSLPKKLPKPAHA
jgi:hypothetical protein